MVKADLTRDYYADLEIKPGATEIEIKKQFRQLGENLPDPILLVSFSLIVFTPQP